MIMGGNMKKKIAIILVLLIIISSMTLVFASCNRSKKDVFKIEGNTVVGLTDYGRKQSKIVVPDGINKINSTAFLNCNNLASVKLPSSVNTIEEGAFSSCFNLREINIPSGVTEIKDSTFNSCINLSKVNIPDTVAKIGDGAFVMCVSLSELLIPSSVSEIADNAFEMCTSLVIKYQEEDIPFEWKDNLHMFGDIDISFPIVYNCKNNDVANDGYVYVVAKNGIQYAIKDSVAKVSGHSYIDKNLVIDEKITYKGVDYPVTEIGDLSLCFSDIKTLRIPSGVKKIGKGALVFCVGLNSVDLPIGLEVIDESAFTLDVELKKVNIPNTVVSIGADAFWSCDIDEIVIPNSVKSIGKNAFKDCYTDIYCEAQSQPDGWDSAWKGEKCLVIWGHEIK